jgi:hypothetical protein
MACSGYNHRRHWCIHAQRLLGEMAGNLKSNQIVPAIADSETVEPAAPEPLVNAAFSEHTRERCGAQFALGQPRQLEIRIDVLCGTSCPQLHEVRTHR